VAVLVLRQCLEPDSSAQAVAQLPILEHPEHDRADKGEGNVRDNHTQLAGESHGKPPWFASQVVVTRKLASRSGVKKSALLRHRFRTAALGSLTWLKSCEINALKSP
jgi:hypothetical protein